MDHRRIMDGKPRPRTPTKLLKGVIIIVFNFNLNFGGEKNKTTCEIKIVKSKHKQRNMVFLCFSETVL